MLRKVQVQICAVLMALAAVYAVWNIIQVRDRLSRAEDYRRQLVGEITMLTKENEEMAQAIARADDREVIEALARQKLGLVMPGERIFTEKENSG